MPAPIRLLMACTLGAFAGAAALGACRLTGPNEEGACEAFACEAGAESATEDVTNSPDVISDARVDGDAALACGDADVMLPTMRCRADITGIVAHPSVMAADALGNIYVGSDMVTTKAIGFSIRKFDANCKREWELFSTAANDCGGVGVRGIAFDASGNAIIYGQLGNCSSLTFASHVFSGISVFVTKLSPTGAHLWSKQFDGEAGARALAVDPLSGRILITGRFLDRIDFGGGELVRDPGACAHDDAFVTLLDSAGGHVFSKRFEAGDCACPPANGCLLDPLAAAFSPKGEPTFGAQLRGTLDLGGGKVGSALTNTTGLLARFDATGTHTFSRAWGSAGVGSIDRLRYDGDGNLFVVGLAGGGAAIDFGSGVTISNDDGAMAWLAHLDPTLAPKWARIHGSFQNPGGFGSHTSPGGVGLDRCGSPIMMGTLGNRVDLGDGPVTPSPLQPAGYMAKYSRTRSFLDKRLFQDDAPNFDAGVVALHVLGTTDVWGGVALTGEATNTRPDFGDGKVGRFFLVRFNP